MKIVFAFVIKLITFSIIFLNETVAEYLKPINDITSHSVNKMKNFPITETNVNIFKNNSLIDSNFTEESPEIKSLQVKSNFETSQIQENSNRILDNLCPWSYGYNESTGKCIFCKDFGKFYQNGKCVDVCNLNTRRITELNVCYKCENLTHVYHNGQCIETCPDNTVYQADAGLCYVCKWVNKYFNAGECLAKCPATTMIDEDNKICVNCKEKGKFVHNMKCLDECPPGTSFYDFFTYFCIDCYLIEKYNLTGKCFDSCGMNFARNIDKCVNCSEIQNFPILNNGKCDTKCNAIDVFNPLTKTCEGCKSLTPSKFLINLNNNSSCVLNCGKYSVNYKMNYCITDVNEYCRIMANSCNNNGIFIFINSKSHKCLCNKNFYGVNCEIQDLKANSNCVSVMDQMIKKFSKVKEINFSLTNDPVYHSIFDDFIRCSKEIPQYLLKDSSTIDIIQEFILTYYSSDEVKSLQYEDFGKFIYNFDILFNLDYFNLWNDHTVFKINGTELRTKRSDYLKQFETFILKLFMLTPHFFKDANFDVIELILGKYDRYWGQQLYVDIFNSQIFNQNVYFKYNKENYNTYFRFKSICNSLPVNSTIIAINLDSDLSHFSDTIEYLSNQFYIGIMDSGFKMTSVDCPHMIYFEMKDNLNFNYSHSYQKWQEIAELGINPLDPHDSYFSEICYKYPLNMSLTNYTRGFRLSNYFMNYSLKCMAKALNSDVTKECKFVGFEDSFEEYGPNPYVKCECDLIDSNSYYYIEILPVNEVPLLIPFIQMWFCISHGFNFLTSFYNPGFFAILLVFVFQGVGLVLHFITLEIQFLDYFELIRRHDMENFGLLSQEEQKKSKLNKIKERLVKSSFIQNDNEKSSVFSKALNLFSRRKRRNEAVFKPKSKQNETAIKELLNLSSSVHMSDYIYLPYTTFLYIDDRDLLIYFCDYWHDYHVYSITFIKFGYFMPRSVRILNFYLYVINHFFFVALILSPEDENIDIFGNDYTQLKGGIIRYAFLSSVYANVVYYLMALFLKIPREIKLYLNKALMKKYYTIREFQKMSTQLIIFIIINITLQLLFSLFVINFNAMYFDIRIDWIYFTCLVLCIDLLMVSNVIPIIALILRVLVKNFKLEKFYKVYGFFERLKNERKYG